MRVVTYSAGSSPARLGAMVGESVLDLASAANEADISPALFASMLSFLGAGEPAHSAALQLIAAATPSRLRAMSEVRLHAPVPRPGKIIAIGLNYRDHAMESGAADTPKAPMIFAKFPTSVIGPNETIVIPAGNPNVDYEAELGVVIGRYAKATPAAKALNYVAGYLPLNDVSARLWQFADRQWVRGKSCDTFCPIGPALVTRDEVPEPHNLAIRARVNGETRQDSNTSKLIFQIPQLIEHISASITLEPGDIIATGTPEGVGAFRKPPVFLKDGDFVEIEIEGLGVLANPVRAGAE